MTDARNNIQDFRDAPWGIGPLAYEWMDKPHMLLGELCDEADTLTRERDEARSLCDETINMLHDADRERDALLGVLAQVRSSVTSAALLGLIDAAMEAP
jgi:hypothetical protein